MRYDIAFVACAAKKADYMKSAEFIYESDLFRKSREWARENADEWWILSAKHGLLSPTKLIDPYNVTLNTKTEDERQAWAKQVRHQLESWYQNDPSRCMKSVAVLAGSKYRKYLVPWMERMGWVVDVPMRGLAIGQQLRWLKENT